MVVRHKRTAGAGMRTGRAKQGCPNPLSVSQRTVRAICVRALVVSYSGEVSAKKTSFDSVAAGDVAEARSSSRTSSSCGHTSRPTGVRGMWALRTRRPASWASRSRRRRTTRSGRAGLTGVRWAVAAVTWRRTVAAATWRRAKRGCPGRTGRAKQWCPGSQGRRRNSISRWTCISHITCPCCFLLAAAER